MLSWLRRRRSRAALRSADAAVRAALLAVLDGDLERAEQLLVASAELDALGVEPYLALAEGRYEGLRDWPMMTHETPLRPSGLYGASKVWGEALGRQYSDAHGLSVICLRIGRVRAEDRPREPREFAVWLSQRDVARMIERCVAAPATVRFDIFFVTSRNRWGYRDIDHARTVVGFEPVDVAEYHRT